MRNLSFLLVLLAFAGACGKKDTIKTHVQAEMLGDGQGVQQSLILPLSDQTVASYDGSLKGVPPIFKGLVGTVMNLGASLGAGKQRLTIIQPVPEIPSKISEIKIKRIFFLIESPENKEVDFDFLRSLAVKVSPARLERKIDTWEPIIESGSIEEKDKTVWTEVKDWAVAKIKKDTLAKWDTNSSGLMLLKYQNKDKENSVVQDTGKMYVVDTNDPHWTKQYFENQYSDVIKRTVILNQTLLVEVNSNAIDLAIFKDRLRSDPTQFNRVHKQAQVCEGNCLDLQVLDYNLISLLQHGNALRIDAYIDPKKAPKSFQLKGFVEFDVKLKAKL